MNGFHNVRFPSRLAFGASGGPQLNVDVTRLVSGHEKRNTRWSQPLRKYLVSVGQRPLTEIRQLLHFFEARNGSLNSFRFRDPVDYSTALIENAIASTDVEIGIGDGIQSVFQLKLKSGRVIQTPQVESLKVAIDGAEIIDGFSVSEITGLLSFSQPPLLNQSITVGFKFDVPVRFENQELIATETGAGAGEISDISLMEVRL